MNFVTHYYYVLYTIFSATMVTGLTCPESVGHRRNSNILSTTSSFDPFLAKHNGAQKLSLRQLIVILNNTRSHDYMADVRNDS